MHKIVKESHQDQFCSLWPGSTFASGFHITIHSETFATEDRGWELLLAKHVCTMILSTFILAFSAQLAKESCTAWRLADSFYRHGKKFAFELFWNCGLPSTSKASGERRESPEKSQILFLQLSELLCFSRCGRTDGELARKNQTRLSHLLSRKDSTFAALKQEDAKAGTECFIFSNSLWSVAMLIIIINN